MPTISRFYGIVIRMYYLDHAPPHFHAAYNEHELVVGISPVEVIVGEAPSRVREMVLEWGRMHAIELMGNWNLCRQSQPPHPIDPLE